MRLMPGIRPIEITSVENSDSLWVHNSLSVAEAKPIKPPDIRDPCNTTHEFRWLQTLAGEAAQQQHAYIPQEGGIQATLPSGETACLAKNKLCHKCDAQSALM